MLLFYRNHAGALAVSVEDVLDGKLILPNGRIVAVGPPWSEIDEDDPTTELSDVQTDIASNIVARLEAMRQAQAEGQEREEEARTEWEAYLDTILDPINDRVGSGVFHGVHALELEAEAEREIRDAD